MHEYRTKWLNPGSKSKPCEIRNVNFLVDSPLVERKQLLRAIVPKNSQSVLFCNHIEGSWRGVVRTCLQNDLEGIVAKHRFGPYLEDSEQ